jgi:hypothetical protein
MCEMNAAKTGSTPRVLPTGNRTQILIPAALVVCPPTYSRPPAPSICTYSLPSCRPYCQHRSAPNCRSAVEQPRTIPADESIQQGRRFQTPGSTGHQQNKGSSARSEREHDKDRASHTKPCNGTTCFRPTRPAEHHCNRSAARFSAAMMPLTANDRRPNPRPVATTR